MKKLLLLLSLFGSAVCQGQHSLLDSLVNLYNNSATDSARCYNMVLLASEYSNRDVDSSLRMMSRAIALAHQLNDDLLLIKAYDVAGFCYGKKADYEKAGTYLYDALRLAEKNGCIDCIGYVKNELAVVEKSKNNTARCLALLQEVMTLDQNKLAVRTRFKVYQNIGLSYNNLGKTDSAMHYFLMALPFADQINNPYAKALLLNNIAIAYHLNNDFERALDYYRRVSETGKTIPDNELLFFGSYNTGDIFLRQKNYDEAIRKFEESLPFALQLKREDYMLYAYGSLLEANEKKGNLPEALRYFHLYDAVKDSSNLKQNSKNVAELETRYQTEKKENQIRLQDLELKQKSAAIFRQRSFLIALLAGIAALLVFSYLFYNRYRLRQKQLLNEAIIKEQQLGLQAVIDAQENERKRIAKDLHDGIAQELVAMKLGFEQFRDKENSGTYDSLLQSLNNACTEVRTISHTMSPPVLENKGLPDSLELLLKNSLGVAGIQHSFELLGVTGKMNEKIETGLYRIAQELINNIIKHAGARQVVVQLQRMGTQLILRVEDDGRGFDFENAVRKGSMGLLNILSRVRALNGTYRCEPGVPAGNISLVKCRYEISALVYFYMQN